MAFDYYEYGKHLEALSAMGCAVVTITPPDIQGLIEDEGAAEPVIHEDALAWMQMRAEDIEAAILGDQWSDTVRNIIGQHPIYRASLLTIDRKRRSTTQGEVLLTYDGQRIEQFEDTIKLGPNGYDGQPDEHWHHVAREWLGNGRKTSEQLLEKCAEAAAARAAAA